MDIITEIDFSILEFIQENIRCIFLDTVLPIITMLCDHGLVPIIAVVVLLIFSKTRKLGLSMGIAFACGGIVGNLLLKNIVARVRPYDINTGIELLIEPLTDFSFPSGHTLIAVECAVVLLLMLKGRLRTVPITASVLAVIIAFSRIYLYVHYPSDVLASLILGTAFGILGTKAGEYVYKIASKNNTNYNMQDNADVKSNDK